MGTDTLSVTFTPTDTTDYKPASATVQLLVDNPPAPIVTPTISWPTPAPITYGTLFEPNATRCRRHGHGKTHAG